MTLKNKEGYKLAKRTGNKMQISVYRIDEGQQYEYEKWDDTIFRIMKPFDKYKPQALKKLQFYGYHVQVYSCNEPAYDPRKIINFYKTIVEANQPLLNAKKQDLSTVMFIYNNDNAFAITSGFGHNVIRNYIDTEFGLKIMSGLITEYDNIKSISEKGIVGSIVANTRYFRNAYKLNDEDDFGKLFKEVCASLPCNVIKDKLGFSDEDIKKNVTCTGKTSFKINKTISIEKVFEVVSHFEKILKHPTSMFNSMVPIYNKGANKSKYNELTNSLINYIFTCVKSGEYIDYDISNSEFDIFYKAASYNVIYNGEKLYDENLEAIDDFQFFEEIKKQDVACMEELEDFRECFSNIRICSYDSDDNTLINDTLLKHLNGELRMDGKSYFMLDGIWLELKDSFIETLNAECKNSLNKYYKENMLINKWKSSGGYSEDKFIDDICTQKNLYKIHPCVTDENIELCDVMEIKDDITYLYFIKDGFDHCVRDLTSQVIISCRRLTELRKSGAKNLLENYFDKIQRKHLNFSIDKNNFMDAFMKNKLTIVVAFRPKKSSASVRTYPEKYNSNIAKYSLVTFAKLFKQTMDYDLILEEIETE